MNIQRYSRYHLKNKMESLASATAKKEISEEVAKDLITDLASGGPDSVFYEKAQKMYPELTSLIEKLFSRRTMIYP